MFEKILYAGWGDMDFNSHMRNTAFLDKSGDVRMMFFAENGFPMSELMRMRIGPVIMKDEVEYYKEITLLGAMKIVLSMAGLSEDGSRFLIRNEFYREDGKLAAKVTSLGGWLNLDERKLVSAPASMLVALQKLAKSADYQTLKSSVTLPINKSSS